MIGCLRTPVRKQPIIALYFEFENVVKFYNLEAWKSTFEGILKGFEKRLFDNKLKARNYRVESLHVLNGSSAFFVTGIVSLLCIIKHILSREGPDLEINP